MKARLLELDFSVGRMTYISDLKPTTFDWLPLFSNTQLIEYQRQLQRPSFNESFSGQPLALEYAQAYPLQMRKDKKTFAKGLAVNGGTRLVYALGGKYQKLLGQVGFDPSASMMARWRS